ncbi:MAG: transcriptional repressor [Succinivibrio sp.]
MDDNTNTNQDPAMDAIYKELEKRGLRMTVQRRHIVQILLSGRISTPKQLWYEAKEFIPDLGIATVYRLITRLEQIGIISKKRNFYIGSQPPKLGKIEYANGRRIFQNEGSTKDLASIIRQGLIASGKINSRSDVRLTLVGDTIDITVTAN